MRGSASASAAVSFLNALFTGVGAAAGIDLWASASVDLAPGGRVGRPVVEGGDSPLVREVADAALSRWSPGRPYRANVQVHSSIPARRGLKSSSAVGSATAKAVASVLGAPVAPEDAARLVAEVSRGIGQSATGAFDDALAGLVPGIHLTDNSGKRVVHSEPVPADWRVLLWIPPDPHPPSPDVATAFRGRSDEAHEAERLARDGRWIEALEVNSGLVESVLQYPYAGIRKQLRDAGALGSGVSGLGPTLASVVDSQSAASARRCLTGRPGRVIETDFTRALPGPPGGLL